MQRGKEKRARLRVCEHPQGMALMAFSFHATRVSLWNCPGSGPSIPCPEETKKRGQARKNLGRPLEWRQAGFALFELPECCVALDCLTVSLLTAVADGYEPPREVAFPIRPLVSAWDCSPLLSFATWPVWIEPSRFAIKGPALRADPCVKTTKRHGTLSLL